MGVESAWHAGYTRKGVLVAVVDDGDNLNHPNQKLNFVSCSLGVWWLNHTDPNNCSPK